MSNTYIIKNVPSSNSLSLAYKVQPFCMSVTRKMFTSIYVPLEAYDKNGIVIKQILAYKTSIITNEKKVWSMNPPYATALSRDSISLSLSHMHYDKFCKRKKKNLQ